jgi:hypothetical protein
VHSPGIMLYGSQFAAGTVTATWRHDSTSRDTIDLSGKLQTIHLEGFEFDSARFRVRHVSGGTGDADIAVFLGDSATESSAAYRAAAAYTLPEGTREGEVRVRDLRLRVDSTTWRSTHEGVVRWHEGNLVIDSLELRDGDESARGRIFVRGTVPVSDAIHLDVQWDSVRIAPWLVALQSDVVADGSMSGQLAVQGTRASPRFSGKFSLARPTYHQAPLPEVQSALDYAERSLKVDAEVSRATRRLARIEGSIPIDLSFADSVVTRFPDAAVAFGIRMFSSLALNFPA